MNIIIVGCGKVGKAIAEELAGEGHNIVVIDKKQTALNSVAASLDIMAIKGNCIQLSTLEDADVEHADLLIAVTNADEINLLCCLIARKCGTKHTISRVRDPEYTQGLYLIKEELGISMVINPEYIAAEEIARLVRFPSAIEIDTFTKGSVELFKISVSENSLLNGLSLNNSSILKKYSLHVCAVERGREVIIPSGDFEILAGDKVTIIGTPRMIAKFCKKIKLMNHVGKNVILIGGGKITFYLAKELLASGADVKIIEIDAKRCMELSEMLDGATIIEGDGMDEQLLIEEGIETADVMVSLTGFDEGNVILSLNVSTISKCKIITKINKFSFENIIDKMDVGSIIHPKYLMAEYVLKYVRAMHNSYESNIESLYSILGGKAEALEFKVKSNSSLIGRKISDLRLKDNLQIACIYRKNEVIIPSGNDVIKPKDSVIIVTTHSGFDELDDILVH